MILVRSPSKRSFSIVAVLSASLCLSVSAQNHAKDEFQTLLKQGFELHQQARFADAIPILNRARKLAPDDYFANLLLGIDLLRCGNAAEAIPRLQVAARVKPSEEFATEYLGEVPPAEERRDDRDAARPAARQPRGGR